MDAYDAIEEGTLEEFKEALAENPDFDWKHFFFHVLSNEDLTARVEIANWMLDHGADPAYIEPHEKINILHVMFTEREHDYSSL